MTHITLTALEKSLWQSWVLFVYIDEALMTLADFNIHDTQRQMLFVEELLKFDIDRYLL